MSKGYSYCVVLLGIEPELWRMELCRLLITENMSLKWRNIKQAVEM
jgi:hypothetical protein